MLNRALAIAFVLSSFAFAQDGPMAKPKELDALNFLAGNWTYEMSAHSPDGSAETSKGATVGKWMLRDRYLQMVQSGTLMEMPLEGMLMLSWDDSAGKYVSVWFDSMSGRPLTGHGAMKDGKLTTTTEVVDFGEAMGGKMRVRMELTKKSNDAFSMKVMGGEEGQWTTFFTSEYKRTK